MPGNQTLSVPSNATVYGQRQNGRGAGGHDGQKDLLYRMSSDRRERAMLLQIFWKGENKQPNGICRTPQRVGSSFTHLHTEKMERSPLVFSPLLYKRPCPLVGLVLFYFFPFLFFILDYSTIDGLSPWRTASRTYVCLLGGGFMEIIRACTPPSSPVCVRY